MIAMLHFAGLVLATIFAAAVAAACNWLLLQVTFHLMQPATVRQTVSERRSTQLSRAIVPNRWARE